MAKELHGRMTKSRPRVQELYVDGELFFSRTETEIEYLWNEWEIRTDNKEAIEMLAELNKTMI